MEYPFKDLLPLDEVLAREGYYKDWTHLDPEVFYSLTQISNFIKTKGYGVDVRLLIAQLAEHFGLKTTQVVDLANLLQQKFTNLEGVTQSFTNNINSLVAQMEADKNTIVANATVDSEVILARGGKATLGQRLDETTAQLDHMHYDVISEGAVGDGVTDNASVFQTLLNKVNSGDTIYFPNGLFLTTLPFKVNKPINLVMKGKLIADHAGIGILIKDDSSKGSFHPNYHDENTLKANIKVNRAKNKGYELQATAIGVDLWNVFSGYIDLDELQNNYIGARYYADNYGSGYAGTTYCQGKIGIINSYKENIVLKSVNGGYVTQNQFYGGGLTGPNHENLEQTHISLLNEGTSVINENTFFGISLEGGFNKAVKARKASTNKFISLRYEMPNITRLFDFENSNSNEFTSSDYVSEAMYTNKYNDNGLTPNFRTETRVTFNDYRLGSIEYYDRIYYIKPQNNVIGRGNTVNNGVLLSRIPEHWNIKIVTQGLSDIVINSSETNTTNQVISVPLKANDCLTIVETSTTSFDSIEFTNPPQYSTELFIKPSVSGAKAITLSVDSSISQIVDKTGTGLISPVGRTFIKLFYDYITNRLYILDYI